MKLYRKTRILFLIILSLTFNILLFGLANAEITKLSSELRNKLQQVSCFHPINKVIDLPVALVKLFANNIADPGQQWQATDLIKIGVGPLPSKRLIWAMACDNFYVIHYEHGGRGTGYDIILGTADDSGKAEILWHGVGWIGENIKNFGAFLDAIKDPKSDLLDDSLDYSK